MEEEEDGDASTPFWLQSRRNNNNTYFRRTASLGGRATTVATQIFFAGAAAILIVFFIIPPFFTSVSQIFRPHLVRKSWDYLNFVLVLFAVLCGFLSRNSNNDDTNHTKEEDVRNKFSSSPSIIDRGGATPRYWLDDRGDQTVYKRFSRLRSVSSYPDLSLREYEDDERWRFYDDTRVSKCRYEDTDPIYPNQSYRNWQEEVKPPPEDIVQPDRNGNNGEGRKIQSDGSEAEKVEVVATTEAEVVEEELTVPSAPPYIPSPPRAPPPQPKQAKRKAKRVYQDVPPKEEKKERAELVAAATPIPPPTSVYQKSNKQEKKKGGATKEFLTALRRKKKKQRQQSIDGLDLLFGSDPPLVYYTMPQPPPPPPPPPPFLQGLFSSKKGKSKRTNTSNPPPPPPPPPPPERRYESRASIAKLRKAPTSKPNPPARVTQFVGTGNESPLLPIPPPPPHPPFKMPAWKFVKRGDYVRMASDISISSDEPDEPDVVAQSAGGSMFCPSPDVDTKADDFIARFRAGLKLEKMNSAKRGRSNLGPEPGLDESGSSTGYRP